MQVLLQIVALISLEIDGSGRPFLTKGNRHKCGILPNICNRLVRFLFNNSQRWITILLIVLIN